MHGRGKKLCKLKAQKQSDEGIIKVLRNPFILKKENKEIKDQIIRDIRSLFEHEDDYCKRERVSNFWSNNYIEYKSNAIEKKTYH